MQSPHDDPSDRLEELFQQALDLSPADRPDFLATACDGDESLRLHVEQLLHAAGEADAHPGWQTPAILHDAASALSASPQLDRYQLGERLGAGGMGVVYRAHRSDGAFEKEVAIKIVPWGAGDARLLERFAEERGILARLDHPNIARLLDGGTTRDGMPYLVMELAEGVPIDEYVRERKSSPRELLHLFRKICAAVSYAHTNLVVHRDLKPSNILVDRNGEPKLLDFGIAKLLDSSESTRTRALTPEYASPEQISGVPVTTASDVYSLGVLLYELISGRRPYRATTSVMDLAQVIVHEEPIPPGPEFDAELANIVLMALRKEPARRYASAEQLSDDLRRWQDGYPISARPDTRAYRLRKFVGRNKLALVAGAAIILSVAGGVTATVREANIANRRFNDLRKLANAYVFEFHDAIQTLPGALAARQLVIKRALEYLDGMAAERRGDRSLTRELADAYTRIAAAQGSIDASLGDFNGALASYARAARLYEELLAAGKNPDIAIRVAEDYARSGYILQQRAQVAAGAAQLQKAIALLESYAGSSPAVHDLLPTYYGLLADMEGNPNFPNLGHTAKAVELYAKALAGNEAVVRAHPKDRDSRMRLSNNYNQTAQMQQAMGNGPAALEAYRHSLESDEALFRETGGAAERRNVAIGSGNLATAWSQLMNNPREAQPFHARSVAMNREIVAADPKDVQARVNLIIALSSAGRTADALGKRVPALALLDEAVALFETMRRGNPGTPASPGRVAYQARADVLISAGNFATAASDIRKQLEIDDQILAANPGDASAERNQAIAWAQTGLIHSKKAEWREALNWYRKAEAVYVAQQQKGKFIARYQTALDSVRKQIQRAEAEQNTRRSP